MQQFSTDPPRIDGKRISLVVRDDDGRAYDCTIWKTGPAIRPGGIAPADLSPFLLDWMDEHEDEIDVLRGRLAE